MRARFLLKIPGYRQTGLNRTTLATESATDFDLGPLSWVQGEIDQALTRGLESLAAYRATGKDLTSLKHARTHIHQAAGAIQMVGLDAVVAFTDEVERQLARLEEIPGRDAQAACEPIERACKKLRIFLDELVNGALLDALMEHGLESGFGVKQLAARVDLQIRRVVEGSAKVADRLRREVLYYVAISAPVAPSVQAVQKGFKLSGLIPSAEVLNA